MLRAISVLAGFITLSFAAQSHAQMAVASMWIAQLGGRATDIYAINPSSAQLLAAGASFAQASIAAYESESEAQQRELAKAHFTRTSYVSTGPNTQVLFGQDNRALVIAVRGSQEPQDWLLDGSDVLIPGFPERVHVGFLRSANSIFDEARNRAVNARAAGKQVWVTGHSLGGAVAQLLAFKLHKDGVTVDGVHTYGSPAVGNVNWAGRYDEALRAKTHRWVNDQDPMVCYPLEQESWEHAGKQNVLSGGNIALNSAMTTCEDAFPVLSVICEPRTWWGRALSVITGSGAFCRTLPEETGLFDLVLNLQSNEFSQHRSQQYLDLIEAELPPELAKGVLLD